MVLLIAGLALVYLKPDVNSYVLPDRLTLDANHFIITILALIAGAYTWIRMKKENHFRIPVRQTSGNIPDSGSHIRNIDDDQSLT